MAHEPAPRISQLLPTVKCTSCSQPVPLADLGDHLCPPLPPAGPAPPKPPGSPSAATALLPQRLHSLVARSVSPPRTEKPSEVEAPLPPARDPFQRLPPDIPTPRSAHVPLPKSPPPPSPAPHDRDRPPPDRVSTPARDDIPPSLRRTRTPSNASRLAPLSPARPVFAASPEVRPPPSPSGRHPSLPLSPAPPPPSSFVRPLGSTPPPLLLRPSGNTPPPPSILRPSGNTPPPPSILRPSGNTPPPHSILRPSGNTPPPPSILRPSASLERVRTSSARVSVDKAVAGTGLDKLPPSLNVRRPSLGAPHTGPTVSFKLPRTDPPPSSPLPFRSSAVAPAPSMSTSAPTPSVSTSAPPPSVTAPARQGPPPPLTLVYPRGDRELDTKIGGEAGMAGVGRRGFQAAARAAMLAATRPPTQPSHATPLRDGHRANVPRYLDINATFGHVIRGKPSFGPGATTTDSFYLAAAITPPLSPNSAHTPSPVSPFPISPVSSGNGTPVSVQYPNLPSPHDATFKPTPAPPNDKAPPQSSDIRIASPSRSPSPIPNPFERRLSGETITQSPMPGTNMPLPLLDVLKSELEAGNESDDESVYTTHTDSKRDENTPSSPTADSDSGLAYTHNPENDTPVVMPLDIRKSNLKNKVKFPTSVSPDGRSSGPSRQTSGASSRSAKTAPMSTTSSASSARARSVSAATQSTSKSVGALERAMESLIEEGASVSVLASGSVLASIGGPPSSRGVGKPGRSNTVPGPASPEQKPPKLPTRSHTSPSHPHVHSERVGLIGEVARIRNRGSEKRKERICAGCSSKIDDGRWIRMDGGKVLCERCWKNMYLPKCRRCNLPIEKQAVSSRDGQLKGKYHKKCFSCHTCQKPFPDKEFYVFDGKPFCAYHYHEANNSLCGASSCGQPIEGPCAVTHLGKRYHPEHLLCEFDDACKQRLEEYWEVDGQMFCERHAAIVNGHDGSWTQADDAAENIPAGADEGRMMKRMTRFIDLGLGAGGEGEPDIR